MIIYTARRFAGTSIGGLIEFLNTELSRIAASFNNDRLLHLETTNVAPTKPRKGDIRLADGTNWNPGAGQGVYAYYNSTWNKLG